MATQSIVLTATDAAWAWSTIAPQTVLTAEAIGGGGGGGGETGYPAGGGGGKGGGYSKVDITKGAETTLNITVGIAGTAGSGGAGGNGPASSIVQVSTTVLLAPGGYGGGGGTANDHYGTGGTTANGTEVGTVKYDGGDGGSGTATGGPLSGAGGGAAGPSGEGSEGSGITAGAHGGGNFLNGVDYCSLGAAGRITTENNGITGPGVGAGGSGGLCLDSTNHTGGAGYRGVVVLTWTLPDLSIKQSECGPEDLSVSMVEVVGSDVRFG
jgi:hypothetical protein